MDNFYDFIKKSPRCLLLLVLGCIGMVRAEAQLGVNLIVNGDAETVPINGNGWVVVSDLGSFPLPNQGSWYLPDNSTYPNPQHTDNGTHQAHSGSYFFSTGVNSNPGAGESGTLTQTIDLVAAGLSGQDLVFNFTGYVSTDGNSGPTNFGGDVVEVKVDYVNGLGIIVYSYDNPFMATEEDFLPPTDFNWHQLTNAQTVTAADNIQTIVITLIGTNDNGASTIQAFYDDLSLVASLPLPITLLNFTAVEQPGHTVGLQWQTGLEENSHYIDIERSADGKSFSSIGQVPAAGNSHMVKDYSFVDASPFSGNNFYRLKLVDLDGKFKYSKVLEIRPMASDKTTEVFSNPFHDQIGLRVAAVVPDRLTLSLMDAAGRICLRQSVNTQSGNNFINLYPSAGMAAGVYFLHIQGSHTDQTIRVLKQ